MKVGVDAIEISRIRRALERYPSFRERCFTEAEREYCDSRKNPAQSYAGRFAGKEAKPSVRLSGRALAWAERVPAGAIDLSMTHNRDLAVAVAIVEGG